MSRLKPREDWENQLRQFDDWLTVEEVSDALIVSEQTVNKWIRVHGLRTSYRPRPIEDRGIGKSLRVRVVSKEDLIAFLAGERETPAATNEEANDA